MADSDAPDAHPADGAGGTPSTNREVELEAQRAVDAYGGGVRTTLRNNATAYGFSVTITSAYGVASVTHPASAGLLQTVLFAVGAVVAFLVVEFVASRIFRRSSRSESSHEVMLAGAVDAISVLAAVASAAGCAQLPGTVAWPATAFGATFVFLLVGGLDVLIAHHVARKAAR